MFANGADEIIGQFLSHIFVTTDDTAPNGLALSGLPNGLRLRFDMLLVIIVCGRRHIDKRFHFCDKADEKDVCSQIDGLLHISEMSWGRIDYPQNVFKKGDTVKVIIKEIKGDKIALSAKFDENNPWLNVESKYPVGSTVKGVVARMTEFGAFIQLEEGVDALLHVSQISRKHIDKPSDVLKTGDEIEAKVVDLNIDEHKISLSLKDLLPEEPEEAEGNGSDGE